MLSWFADSLVPRYVRTACGKSCSTRAAGTGSSDLACSMLSHKHRSPPAQQDLSDDSQSSAIFLRGCVYPGKILQLVYSGHFLASLKMGREELFPWF